MFEMGAAQGDTYRCSPNLSAKTIMKESVTIPNKLVIRFLIWFLHIAFIKDWFIFNGYYSFFIITVET